ncbi:MAG: hypothetical protein NWE89_15770 [Candidatus Bathyarchaeota archaeon]|nr:hypothetical protein [Candidatus Bathyarchaeota archaeon]
MGLNVDSLKQQLNDEDYLKILNHCREPKTFKEIRKTKVKEGKLFKALKELKLSEALLFADGKYYTAPDALLHMD